MNDIEMWKLHKQQSLKTVSLTVEEVFRIWKTTVIAFLFKQDKTYSMLYRSVCLWKILLIITLALSIQNFKLQSLNQYVQKYYHLVIYVIRNYAQYN